MFISALVGRRREREMCAAPLSLFSLPAGACWRLLVRVLLYAFYTCLTNNGMRARNALVSPYIFFRPFDTPLKSLPPSSNPPFAPCTSDSC